MISQPISISRFYFCFLLYAIAGNSYAQEYTPMDFDQGVWMEESLSKPFFTYYQKYCEGDTILDGQLYNKLYEFRLQETMAWFDTIPSHYIGAIRETEDRNVLFWGINDTSFTIIYDFNIDIGDTLKLEHEEFVVNIIDSVEYCGQYRKRFIDFYYDEHQQITLTEGVGFSNGLLGHYGIFDVFVESYHILKCYTEWDNLLCADCNILLDNYDIDHWVKILVYPNPVTQGQLVVVKFNESFANTRIELYNTLGKLLDTYISNGEALSFPAPVETGLYIIRVMDETELVESRKIIVQ